MKSFSLTFILLIAIFSGNYAQEVQEESTEIDKSLNSEFDLLKKKSETYDDFKVIRETRLDEFWTVVQDSLSQLKQNLLLANETISEQQLKSESLEDVMAAKEEQLSQSTYEMTHISFMGMNFTKTSFIITSVITLLALIVLIVVGFVQYRYKSSTANSKIRELSDIRNQFEEFKKISLEKQIKLNRELQTERNVVEELRSKSTITKKITA